MWESLAWVKRRDMCTWRGCASWTPSIFIWVSRRLSLRPGCWALRFDDRSPALQFSSLALCVFVLSVFKAWKSGQASHWIEGEPWKLIEPVRTLTVLSRKAHFPDSVLSDRRILSSSSSWIALPRQPSSTWVTFGPAASLNWAVEAGWPGEESPRFGEWRFGFYSQLSILGQAWPPLSGLSCSCNLQRLGIFLFWALFFFFFNVDHF